MILSRPATWATRTLGAAARSAADIADTVGSLTGAGLQLAALPARAGAAVLTGQTPVSTLTRRAWCGSERAWIEVRGLAAPDGAQRGQRVVEALRAQPGVAAVRVNRPLQRVVVDLDATQSISLNRLCRLVEDAEATAPTEDPAASARGRTALPGDGLLLATRGLMIGVNTAGLAIAVAGRVLRWPAAPLAVDAAATFASYQPWLRRRLHERFGAAPTDTVLALAGMGARIATLTPAPLAVDLAMQGLKAAESQAIAASWTRHEPVLARHAEAPEVHHRQRPIPLPDGPAQRHATTMGYAQVLGAAAVGALTRDRTAAANAVVITAPKAVRAATEAFAATLGRDLADRHGVLILAPAALRRLDRVDALLLDPRILADTTLRVVRLRGADDAHRDAAWQAAQNLVGRNETRPGWHRLTEVPGSVEALIAPAPLPLAAAVIEQARATGVELVGLDSELLGELRPAFDQLIAPHDTDSDDATLAETLGTLQQAGRTVAVVSTSATAALCSADLGLGMLPADPTDAPPWQADLLLADLDGLWQVLHALPAAKAATKRGIAISTGATSLASVLMVPGVRGGRGPGPVTVGAAAGMVSGCLLARRATRTPAPRPAPAHDWHALSVPQVQALLPTPGPDRVAAPPPPPPNLVWQFLTALRAELSDPLMPVLGLCSAATAMLGSPIDATMVSTVLIGNCMLAAAQQVQAENRLTRMLAHHSPPARTLPAGGDGDYVPVAAEALLPGTVIEVRATEVVPADARLIAATDLEVDESSLTGESLSVEKDPAATPGAPLAERRCMLYAGTTVVAGTAVAVVTAVGADTQARCAAELAAGQLPVVGLGHQLSALMARAFPASAAGGAAVGLLGLLRGGTLRVALGNAIAVAVAAVPEGMPLMATLAQHASGQRLSKHGALVRIPRTVEALGRVEVVCFDKTGTLSENRLRVTRVHPVAEASEADVLACAANTAPADVTHAHATDRAVLDAADQLDAGQPARWSSADAQLPFRSGRAFAAARRGRDVVIKGAPEVVMAACADLPAGIQQQVDTLAAQGLRVLAVARRRISAAQARAAGDDLAGLCGGGLSLIGFLGIADTPRADAPVLLSALSERGVGVRLITGDHPVTATAIAAELGLDIDTEQVITSAEWNMLSRSEQEQAVAERVIFARMSPENKVQVVQTLERSGWVTAMVGDGANDAAAIRAASVGLGVVARGSDSAHATADIVLTDGRIGALVDAVDEGRRLWRGVQLAVTGLLGGNLGEVLFGVIGTAVTGTSPLNNRQLLLMNMLTDALPATAVAVSTPAGPAGRVVGGIDEPALVRAAGLRGVITGVAAAAGWGMAALTGRPGRAATVALITLVTTELAQTLLDSRAPLVIATAAGSFAVFAAMITTPGVSQLLGCTSIGPLGWAVALGSAGAAVIAIAVAPRLLPARWAAAIAESAPVQPGVDTAEHPAPADAGPADRDVVAVTSTEPDTVRRPDSNGHVAQWKPVLAGAARG